MCKSLIRLSAIATVILLIRAPQVIISYANDGGNMFVVFIGFVAFSIAAIEASEAIYKTRAMAHDIEDSE